MRQLYSVRNDRLGITFSPAKRASPSSSTELMTWLCRAVAEELQGQERPDGAAGGDHLRSGEARPRRTVQPGMDPAMGGRGTGHRTWCGRRRGGEVKSADVGDVGDDRRGLVGPFVVAASRQLGEALFLEDRGDRRRAERLAVAGQRG